MNTFQFEKSLLVRLEESENVLKGKNSLIPASAVRSEWAYHIELQIEPAGWQALWKISRATCEELNIKYPTVVYGTVNNVFFKELKAEFTVTALEDDDIHIADNHEVPLEDLWPTIDQENAALNVDQTADCIDQLRFFYRSVWMPWDNDSDDDLDWAEKHLESRIRFCFDLKRGMSRAMADHIRLLLIEARYIQNRREIIEEDMRDISDEEDLDETPNRGQLTNLMHIHLRLAIIRNEIELLENTEMRQIYDEINFQSKPQLMGTSEPNIYLVTKRETIEKQMECLEVAKSIIGSHKMVQFISSLKDCLKVCASRDEIYIPSGRHIVKFLEPLNSMGSIRAIRIAPESDKPINKNRIGIDYSELDTGHKTNAIIMSEDNDSTLLVFNGDYTIENVWLDCRNVRRGLWCRRGTITLKNCRIIGDEKSSTGNGVVVADGATCILENSIIQNFANGIRCENGGKLLLKESKITSCRSGLDFNDESSVECESSQIENSFEYGLVYAMAGLINSKKIIATDCTEFHRILNENNKSTTFTGAVRLNNNQKGNIAIYNQEEIAALKNAAFIEDSYTTADDEMSCGNKKKMRIEMDISK